MGNNKIVGENLFRREVLLIFILTVMAYFTSYLWECLTAIAYGFDVEFITITTSSLIKNVFICLIFVFAVFLPILFDSIANKNNNSGKNKIFKWDIKRCVILIIFIMIFIIILKFTLEAVFSFFTPLVIVIASSLGFGFCLKQLLSESNILKILFYIMLAFIILIICVTGVFFFNSFDKSTYQQFEYKGKEYVLLRIYETKIVAKEIATNQIDQQSCKKVLNNKILYLESSNIDGELYFTPLKMNNIFECQKTSK